MKWLRILILLTSIAWVNDMIQTSIHENGMKHVNIHIAAIWVNAMTQLAWLYCAIGILRDNKKDLWIALIIVVLVIGTISIFEKHSESNMTTVGDNFYANYTAFRFYTSGKCYWLVTDTSDGSRTVLHIKNDKTFGIREIVLSDTTSEQTFGYLIPTDNDEILLLHSAKNDMTYTIKRSAEDDHIAILKNGVQVMVLLARDDEHTQYDIYDMEKKGKTKWKEL